MASTHAPPDQTVSRAHRLPLPVTEPPFDDELGIVPGGEQIGVGGWHGREIPGQGLLPLALEPDAGLLVPPATTGLGEHVVADSLWLRYPGAEPPGPARGGPGAPPGLPAPAPAVPAPRAADADGLPDPRRWIARLAQSALECLHGRRSLQQLIRWTDEPVYRALARRTVEQEGAPAERPRIRSLRVCRVTGTVAEASVVVQLGAAVRAVAVRLEADDGRWLCTAFDIVEPGPPHRGRSRSRQGAAQASSKATA